MKAKPMTAAEAIDIVAKHAIAYAAEDFTENGWESYPEIGEDDWLRVVARITQLGRADTVGAKYAEAYELLTKRAEK